MSEQTATASPNLREKAYRHICRQLFLGELSPGDRLVNRTLAAQLGTSFIPVREAISRLASEGVVELVNGAGAFVRKFDQRELSEIYDVRELVEPFAAAKAAQLMSDHELSELKSLLRDWEEVAARIGKRKRGATAGDFDEWLSCNARFREVLIAASRNRTLSKIVRDVHLLSQCFAAQRGLPGLLSADLVEATIRSHRGLVEALQARDASGAEAIVREQLRYGRSTVLAYFESMQSRP